MPRYAVTYTTTASHTVEVEADDAQDARRKADEAYDEQAPGSLCYQCSNDYDIGDFEQDDSDGAVWQL
jgi:hypothetical protein